MADASPTFSFALALGAGILAQSLARQIRLPAIVLLLAAGVALGPDGLGWIDPHVLGEGLFGLIDIGVAVILFEGGLNLEASRLRRQEGPIRRLLTLGALVTLAGATLAVRALLGWPWSLAVLFGSLVVVTGPTVVSPLVRELRLRPELRTVIEAEGVLIDPIGAILAVVLLQIVLVPAPDTIMSGLAGLIGRLAFGTVAGAFGGFALGGLLRVRGLVPQGLENVFSLATVVLLFVVSDRVLSHSGILAVTVAGVVVGNLGTPVDRDLREFKDQLTVMLVGLLFVLLAAGIHLEDVRALGGAGALVIVALVLIVRPIGVWIATRGSALTTAEKVMVAWMGPRGIVAAAIATLTAETLEVQNMPGGPELRALVFLTIGATVLLVGLTALPLATLLKLRLPSRDRIAILGAQGLGLALGEELKRAGVPVVFLDSDPRHCREAEEAGFAVVFGDALSERTLQRAQIDLVGLAIGATPNDHLNSLFVTQARDLFRVPRGAVAVNNLPSEKAPQPLSRQAGDILFGAPTDLERWDVRWRHRDVSIEPFLFQPVRPSEVTTDAGERPSGQVASAGERTDRAVLLAFRRGRRTLPMTSDVEPREGDQGVVALYAPERDKAVDQLAALGWQPGRASEPTPSPGGVEDRPAAAHPHSHGWT
jgi:NhaP-type Na+/H+ or K+/H+ antiporter